MGRRDAQEQGPLCKSRSKFPKELELELELPSRQKLGQNDLPRLDAVAQTCFMNVNVLMFFKITNNPIPGSGVLKPLEFLEMRTEGVSCQVNKVILDP